MTVERVDRRVRRTRQLIRDAFIALARERGYDRVSVQDILDRADVGRSTFYAHYRDKDDLLVREFEALHPAWGVRPADPDVAGATTGFLEPLRDTFRDAEANRQLYAGFLGRHGSESVRRLLPEPLSNIVRQHVRAHFSDWPGDDQRLEAASMFIATAFLGTLTWWLDTDAPLSGDDVFTICQELAAQGAAAFFSS